MGQKGYFSSPTMHKNWVYFITDDDLFKVDLHGGIPRRLTSSLAPSSCPHISPDGASILFLSNEHGQRDAYVMDSEGGEKKRLTHFGDVKISGFKDNKHAIVMSAENSFHRAHTIPYLVNIDTFERKSINVGHACSLEYGSDKSVLLGRNLGDPARWKRYKGGTLGRLWLSRNGKSNFVEILKNLKSHLANPRMIGKRIYFISDHEGIGNIYSSNYSGINIKRHTHHNEYYVRSFNSSNEIIVYQCGAEIYQLDLKNDQSSVININDHSGHMQSVSRFESSYENLQDINISAKAEEIAVILRGQLYVMPPWGGAPEKLSCDHSIRIKKPYLIKNKKEENEVVCISMSDDAEEELIIFNRKESSSRKLKLSFELGKVFQLLPHPKKYEATIVNNRTEIWQIDLKTGQGILVDKNKYVEMQSMNWSNCGSWLAYKGADSKEKSGIKVWNHKTKNSRFLINPILEDSAPVFDPSGDYLYFIGIREFNPVYSETHFDLSFPAATRPYVVCLREDVNSPLDNHLDYEIEDEDQDEDEEEPKRKVKKKKKTKKKSKEEDYDRVEIDFDGINQRILALPMKLGNYHSLYATEESLFFIKSPITPLDPDGHWMDEEENYHLGKFNFKSKKIKTFHTNVDTVSISSSLKHALIETEGELRLLELESKPTEGDKNNKKDGWIDLNRIKLRINPREEWGQMYREAWVLQRENFWTKDMSKIDWVKIYKRYKALLPKVNTRGEFSDLMWEMQGELGTSHCYEFGGDYYKKDKKNINGKLASNLTWNKKSNSYIIQHILSGDSWLKNQDSPLNATAVNLSKGDEIYAINGISFTHANSLYSELDGLANKKTTLKVKRKGKKDFESLIIKPLTNSANTAYREWVNKNQEFVHRKSNGKVGYLHIPDMSTKGFSEFYRHYLSEFRKDSIIIDVRYNGGGNVSQLLLKMLKQKVIGFDTTRHYGTDCYPQYALAGNIICLTNEFAGSDGDIFSHSFKLMGLGKLIGKRTWGGVVGIWPRFGLMDGTFTTQPEFSFWFQDVGFGVENYGTEPDIDVEITPDNWIKGIDTQLERSISEALKGLKKTKLLKMDLKTRPSLKLPKLPNI
jgi:tricorn protease